LRKAKTQKQEYLTHNFYEIKVRAGWAATGGGGLLSDELSSAIKDNQVEMFLVLPNISLSFRMTGL
jgi:hypothetical protein